MARSQEPDPPRDRATANTRTRLSLAVCYRLESRIDRTCTGCFGACWQSPPWPVVSVGLAAAWGRPRARRQQESGGRHTALGDQRSSCTCVAALTRWNLHRATHSDLSEQHGLKRVCCSRRTFSVESVRRHAQACPRRARNQVFAGSDRSNKPSIVRVEAKVGIVDIWTILSTV